MVDSLLFQVVMIGVIGIGAQWLAWNFRVPAIVAMSLAGLLAGPIFGVLNPKETFGDIFQTFISIAVAIILFEGSLNLNFKEIRGLARPIVRIITLGAFIAWILGSFAAHYVAGLSWAVAFVIGGLFIVTGPTVILPILRQAKLKQRPASILKWEGIIVDPLGALLAVFAFEIILFLTSEEVAVTKLLLFFFWSILAAFIGWLTGVIVGWMFEKGHVPEFLRSPVVLSMVTACFMVADEIKHETGLLAVTAMGIKLANMNISSFSDMRHFKENMSVLLMSAVYIMITAGVTRETLLDILNWNIIGYILLMIFLVRPLSIWLSTINTDITKQEKTLVGWIAPRGIVALTVSGYFAQVLLDTGYTDANLVIPMTLGLVFSTVVAHGFSIRWVAEKLGLAVNSQPGVLIVGSNSFSISMAKVMIELNIPVLLADSSQQRLEAARETDIETYHGEILSELYDHELDLTPYEYMVAASIVNSYNALVCRSFVQEMGRNNIYSLHNEHGESLTDLVDKYDKRILTKENISWHELNDRVERGFHFNTTKLTKKSFAQCVKERSEQSLILFILKSSGKIEFSTHEGQVKGEQGDIVVSLDPPASKRRNTEETAG
ncbi:cation:proton antiporter [Halobacillus naozhouensis]|uniref:Sodium:proton antiporter n=1 Tax=Halobacillus naozhouensis TaxID=554880 RepID=A0ABY8J016_9BACI|nr:sodium:proton antiporter [Halobacillus naozhouensis]WFT74899.1 sodium:proton antiporter [Halobacillus naozhouensis]